MRKIFSILLISILFFNLMPFENNAYAISTYKKITKYHLDLGCVHVWTDGSGYTDKYTAIYQNGISYNSSQSFSTTLTFSDDIQNIKTAYVLDPDEFQWDNTALYSFNSTKYLKDEDSYRNNYYDYVSDSISGIKATLSGSHTVNLSYTANLKSDKDFDLTSSLNSGQFDFIIDLLGGKSSVKSDLYNLLEDGDEKGVGEGVFAYIFFVPIVVEYQVIEKVEVPIGDFIPGLDVPTSAHTGESFPVIDTTVFGDTKEFAESKLQYSVNGGSKKVVTEWEGTTLNTNINQTFDEECTATYYLTVWNKYGDSKSVNETIEISDDKEINGQAVLELESPYGYEGHPFDVYDYSTFEVDGESYSAKRAYEEKIARSRYRVTSGTIRKDGLTSAICTIPKKGFYPITLDVTLTNGDRLSDNKIREVRKTPYVIDNLGGFQKQNRKQVLTFNIATYPDKPIVDYDIRIKDLKSNEIINLTKDAPQENGACIKTRTVKEEIQDKYWTTLTVEFLTKYPRYSLTGEESQKFSYKIKVTDSKGDSDEAYQTFEVVPDKPPVPAIDMQTTFFRSEGTNNTKLQASDGSKSDGDQLQRVWSVIQHNPLDNKKIGEFINAETLNGYENLAFGTNQTIGWNKEGVGKSTVKLNVKDIWIEPTLKEYIKPSDYLEAETTMQTDVINIAPKVSIEPLETLKANIAILVDRNKLEDIKNKSNELKAELIENDIDGNLRFVPVTTNKRILNSRNAEITDRSSRGTNTSDSNRMYLETSFKLQDGGETKTWMGVSAYNNTTLKKEWGVCFKEKTYNSAIAVDNNGKYLVYEYTEKYDSDTCALIVLNTKGQILTKINLDSEFDKDISIFSSNDGDRLYYVGENGIMAINLKSGNIKKITDEHAYKARLVEGKIGFIGGNISKMTYYVGALDMNSEQIEKQMLPMIRYKEEEVISDQSQGGIKIEGWSNDGKVLVSKGDKSRCIWLLDAKTMKQGWAFNSGDREVSLFLCNDKNGNSAYFGVGEASKGTSRYYNDVYLYKAECLDARLDAVVHWNKRKVGSNKIPNAGYYEKNTGIAYMVGLNFYGKGWSYDTINNKWLKTKSGNNFGLSSWSGKVNMYDDLYTNVYYGNDSMSEYGYMLSNGEINTSTDESASRHLIQEGDFKYGNNNYVVSLGLGQLKKAEEIAKNKGATVIRLANSIKGLGTEIKKLSKEPKYQLRIKGDGKANVGGITKELNLDPENEYEYSYDIKVLSGKATDLFNIKHTSEPKSGERSYYKQIVYRANFTTGEHEGLSNDIVKILSGTFMSNTNRYQNATGIGQGEYDRDGHRADPAKFEINMAEDGYVTFNTDGFRDTYKLKVDDKLCAERDYDEYYSEDISKRMAFLTKGKHIVELYTGDNSQAYVVQYMEVGYLRDNAGTFKKQEVKANSDGVASVSGKFSSGYPLAYTVLQESQQIRVLNYQEAVNQGYIKVDDWSKGYYNIQNNGQDVYGTYTGRIGSKNNFSVVFKSRLVAPQNYVLMVHTSRGYKFAEYDEYSTLSFIDKHHYGSTNNYSRTALLFSDFYCVAIPKNLLGFKADSDISIAKNKALPTLSFDDKLKYFYMLDYKSDRYAVLQKCRMGAGEISDEISLSTDGSSEQLDVLLSNFCIKSKTFKYTSNGVYGSSKFNYSKGIELENWRKAVRGNGKAEIELVKPIEKEEDAPLVYKKGELVKYKINYSDYEKDPSKCGYWLYAHTPYNDGEHPNAAIIYDEDGNIKSVCGQEITTDTITIDEALDIAKSKGLKILEKPIDRFYVDGKYTVYHWQYDNTSRSIVSGGYPVYDKASNTAELTFYVEGSASAPWITGISTSPNKVKENAYFSINVGIDDLEKDPLYLTTEVYKDKKHIFTHRKKNILPLDEAGKTTTDPSKAVSYPVINTGALPDKAQAGKYEVVCTVRDQTGAGLGTYKFIVVSEGKIVGLVHHTEQWDINRKKYNVNRFKSEINKSIPYAEYMKLKEPRTRGTNVFWSGEKFMLNSEVAGSPTKVTCSIKGTRYETRMKNSGKKNVAGEAIYTGVLWDKSMINKWGRKEPIELTFTFTATYSGNITKKHEVKVIVDNMEDYWKLHRVF